MYVLAGLLVVGFFCNLAITAVPGRLFAAATGADAPAPLTAVLGSSAGRGASAVASPAGVVAPAGWGMVAAAWLLVGVPLAWGVFQTLSLARQMIY
jgi:hypothetical protein